MKKIIIVFLTFSYSLLNAQGIFENSLNDVEKNKTTIDFSGYVRASAFGGGEDYDYSSIFGETSIQGKFSNNNMYLFTEIELRSGLQFNKTENVIELTEAYVGYIGEKFDLLLGNQIVTWGRTDGFNPTNNITPNDYFFLTAEPDDLKLSNFLVRIKYRINSKIDLDLIAIPVYKPSVYRYDLFEMGENVSFSEPSLPDKTFENASLAARLNFEFSKIGFSASYFRGYDSYFGFDVKSIDFLSGTPIITNSATSYLKNTIGADFALPINSWILRGETAYNISKDYKKFIYTPNPNIDYVIGVEHNFWGVTTILQYIGKYNLDFNKLQLPVLDNPTDPLAQMQFAEDMIIYESTLFNRKTFYQQEESNHAVALLLSKALAYDTWNIELAGYYNITSEELMIRPKVTWKITDALATTVGGNYMKGPDNSIFAHSSPILNGVFLELKAIF
ncbi:MAG: hypothetical protein U9R42_02395 [Bacteroidota bacterium]|nr:hypothetical protein [Bacteroidota bacterium]